MNHLKRTSIVVAGAVLGIVGGRTQANAQITQVSPGVYKFQMKYVKGQKFVYQMSSSTTMVGVPAAQMQMMGGGNGNQYAVKSVMTVEVIDVKNGVATLRTSSGGMTMNGKPMGGKTTSSTIKVKALGGQVVGGSGNVIGQMGLPDRPLKVGETFTTKNAVQTPGVPMSMNATSKFFGR